MEDQPNKKHKRDTIASDLEAFLLTLTSTTELRVPKGKTQESREIWKFFQRSSNQTRFIQCTLCAGTGSVYDQRMGWICWNDNMMPLRIHLRDFHSGSVSFQEKKVATSPSDKQEEQMKAIVAYIAEAGEPFRLIARPAFQKLMNLMAGKTLPFRSPSWVSRTAIPSLWTQYRQELKEELERVDWVSLTIDLWSSDMKDEYMGTMVHWIGVDWKLHTRMLFMEHVTGSTTAVNLASYVQSAIQEFHLGGKISAIVTDEGANMKNMVVKQLDLTWFPCFCHRINTAILRSFKVSDKSMQGPELQDLLLSELEDFEGESIDQAELHMTTLLTPIRKAKKMVAVFTKSCILTAKLELRLRHAGSKHKRLIRDVPTRWFSTLALLERLREIYTDVEVLLKEHAGKSDVAFTLHDLWTPSEMQDVSEMIAILSGFREVSVAAESQQYPTISRIANWTHTLIRTVNGHLSQSPAIKFWKIRLVQAVKHKFEADTSFDGLLYTTAVLDPIAKEAIGRFHRSDFDKFRQDTKLKICSEIRQLNKDAPLDPTPQVIIDASLPLAQIGFATPNQRSPAQGDAFINYLHYPPSDRGLDWWKENATTLPRMIPLVKKYLCIPGASVSVERAFSVAGQIDSPLRANLAPQKMKQCTEIRLNAKFRSTEGE